jgi:hypothetical protein
MYIIVTAMTRILPIDAKRTKAMHLSTRLTSTATTPETNRTYIWNASSETGISRHSAAMLPTTGIVTVEHREIEQFA